MKVFIVDKSEIYARGLSRFLKGFFPVLVDETVIITAGSLKRPFHPITSSRILVGEVVLIDIDIYKNYFDNHIFPFVGDTDEPILGKLIVILDHPDDLLKYNLKELRCNGVLFRSMNKEQIGYSFYKIIKRSKKEFYIDINFVYEATYLKNNFMDTLTQLFNFIHPSPPKSPV